MTLTDLRTRLTDLLKFDLDNFGATADGTPVSNTYLDAQLNWALRLLSKKLFLYDPLITLTLTGSQNTYDLRGSALSRDVIWVHYVTIGGEVLRDVQQTEPGMWTMTQLVKRFPTYTSTSAGTVLRAVQADRSLILHPAPSGTGSNNSVAGRYMAAALSSGSDVPDIPEELHEIIATLAAIKASEPQVSESEGWNRLARFDAAIPDQVVMAAKTSYMGVFGTLDGLENHIVGVTQAA